MVPGTAVFVVGNHDHHVAPLRACAQLGDEIRDVRIAIRDRSVAWVLIEIALRLVERDRRQAACGDIGEQVADSPSNARRAARHASPGSKFA